MSHQAGSARGPRGCEQCRTAKKKCTFEQPSCARCLRQGKQCSGSQNSRDLRIRDQTLAVTNKYSARKKVQSVPAWVSHRTRLQSLLPMAAMPQANADPLFSRITGNDSCDIKGGWAEDAVPSHASQGPHEFPSDLGQYDLSMPDIIMPKPEDVATNYFLRHFAFQNGQFEHVIKYASQPEKVPSLTLAIQACGMAALSNVRCMPSAGTWTRHTYGKALKLVNSSLRDERRSTTDESLIAVNMLSFYEVSYAEVYLRNPD